MVKLFLGAFMGATAVIAGYFGSQVADLNSILPGTEQTEQETDPEKLKAAIEENTKTWQKARESGERTRQLYQQRLQAAAEKRDFVHHQQTKLAVAYKEAVRDGFPMKWISSYYEQDEALDQLDRLLQEQERLNISCKAYEKAIQEAQKCISEAIETIASNEQEMMLVEIQSEMERFRQMQGNQMPESEFLQGLSQGPVRSVDELMAEQREVNRSSERLTRLNELLAEATVEDDDGSKELPNRITKVLD